MVVCEAVNVVCVCLTRDVSVCGGFVVVEKNPVFVLLEVVV